MQQKQEKIPLHTRFGLRLLQVLLILFALLLVKRCVVLYSDNKQTSTQTTLEYFDKGFQNGKNRALGLKGDPEPPFTNYALKKAYREGYRQGWDEGRHPEQQE